MNSDNLQSQRLDHLGIVAGICNDIGLSDVIDQKIGSTGRKVRVGQAIQAMVINALGFISRPLYLTPEFFENKPVDLLVGEGIEAVDLNDDCLGRALDALFSQGVTELFAAISARALQTYGIETRFAHLDNTTFSLHGAYEKVTVPDDGEPIPITITHGYSRDHRPDLKQAVMSLICANSASLPTWMEALSGNTSDHVSFRDTISTYMAQFGDEAQMPVLVADAALYNEPSLKNMPEGTRWLTRVPATVALVKTLQTGIDDDDLFVIDADTRYTEIGSYYAGIHQRWVLVQHELNRRKQDEALEKRVEKERVKAQKALERLMNKDFGCEDAVCKAVDALKKTWRYHDVTLHIRTEKRYDQRGRPTDASPSRTVWRFNADLTENTPYLEAERRTHGKYVVATNVLDEADLSPLEMVAIYKEQSTSVERGFRFLKDPMFFAHSLFLKKPSRIMALLMVMGVSLLVYALAERQIREQLGESGETIPDQRGKPTQKPTARRIFQMMEGIDVLTIEQAGIHRRLILNLTDLRRQILNLFSPSVRKIYNLPE
jgi:transposase